MLFIMVLALSQIAHILHGQCIDDEDEEKKVNLWKPFWPVTFFLIIFFYSFFKSPCNIVATKSYL